MLIYFTGTGDFLFNLLCNEVCPYTSHWKQIAIQLEIELADIDKIYRNEHDESDRFMRMVGTWRRRANPPFTLITFIEVLETSSVDERLIAHRLRTKYNIPEPLS